jgi:hypothetical protein
MTTPIAVECFDRILAKLDVPAGLVAGFKDELPQILQGSREFPPGLELPLVFAEQRRRFIEAHAIPVPTLPDALPRLEELFQRMTAGERREVLELINRLEGAKEAAAPTPLPQTG